MLLSILACKAIGGEIPLTALTGETQDISPWLQFEFYEPVYYATGKAIDNHNYVNFPLDTAKQKEIFVGVSYSVGNLMSFEVLTQDTQKVIYQSLVQLAKQNGPTNKKVEAKVKKEFVKEPDGRKPFGNKSLDPRFMDPQELVGRSYLSSEDTDGTRRQMKIVQRINDMKSVQDNDPEFVKL